MSRIKNAYEFKYYENPKKKTVTCRVRVLQFDDRLYLYRTLTSNAKLLVSGGNSKYPQLPKQEFVGVARFKPGDHKDVEFAKAVARAKALRQANAEMANYLNMVGRYTKIALDQLTQLENGTRAQAEEYGIAVYDATHDFDPPDNQ